MRFRASAGLWLAFLVLSAAGCSLPRRPSGDLEYLTAASRAGAAPQRQYGLSVNPYQAVPRPKADEFNFSHPRVDDFVTRFQTDLRGFFSRALSRSGRYVPRMSSILQKEGLPEALAYLPLIESGFRPQAVSRAGAVGPWQFIPGTGRRYGLRIDRYVDERRDPVKSTRAAARYLKDLHAMFGDWHLSLAAYNTGEGNISRILEEGGVDDFWEMSDAGYLYQETEDFVPEFLAAVQIAGTPEAYGFERPEQEPLRYDLVKTNRSLPLSRVARLSGTSTKDIQELNPALHRGVTPPNAYAVRVPKGSKEIFEIAYANLEQGLRARRASPRSTHNGRVGHHTHRVRRGETVASIAKRTGVSVKALLKANGIRNPRNVKAGRTLRVPAVARQDATPVMVAKQKGRPRIIE